MAINALITRDELLEKLHEAQKKIIILGVMSLDLDWCEFAQEWAKKIASGGFKLSVFRESENFIYGKSLIAENKDVSQDNSRRSFSTLLYSYKSVVNELRYIIYKECLKNGDEKSKRNYKNNFSLRTMCLDIPIPVIQIDDDYFLTMTLTKFSSDNRYYEQVQSDSLWHNDYKAYFNAYLVHPDCSLKYSGAAKYKDEGEDDEILELYDNERIARGLYPRDCFYDTINSQLVVWAFIFNRKGKLLLHRRKWNAKDNQGMWDKSVGGHIAYRSDFDSTEAVSRELIEELFKKEEIAQTHTHKSYFVEDIDEMIFLGDWRPEVRFNMPFEEIKRNEREWLYFRLHKSTSKQRKSDRIMPPQFFDKEGNRIALVDLKFKLDKNKLICMAKNSKKFEPNFNDKTEDNIFDLIDGIITMELLDEKRAEMKHKTWQELSAEFDIKINQEERKKLNVITDIYLFVASADLSSGDAIEAFKNSDYQLLDLEEIKERAAIGGLTLSPDMETTLANTDGLMSILDDFALRIKRTLK
jgi:isopentenyldiphosphate isomerase